MWPYTDEEYDLFFNPEKVTSSHDTEVDVEAIYAWVEQVMLNDD